VSAVIDPAGGVVATLPLFEPGVLTATVQGYTGLTPYARWGNTPVVLGMLLILLGARLASNGLGARRHSSSQ
jgi:apolipoprotein N-acyltransferase